MSTTGPERIIAVGGGKGGVGKSIVAVNLALAIADAGRSVTLVDGDLGAANLHTLMGIDQLGPTLHAVIQGETPDLCSVAIPTLHDGVKLVPGAGARVGATQVTADGWRKLAQGIRTMKADVVVIDVGAGTSAGILDLFALADLRCVVLTPQLTSVQNAYAFMKAAVYRAIADAARTPAQLALFQDACRHQDTARVHDVLRGIAETDVQFATRAQHVLTSFGARLIGNQMFAAADETAIANVARMFQDFLGVSGMVIGTLMASRRMHNAVNARVPLLASGQDDANAHVLRAMAQRLLADDVDDIRAMRDGKVGPGLRAPLGAHAGALHALDMHRRARLFALDTAQVKAEPRAAWPAATAAAPVVDPVLPATPPAPAPAVPPAPVPGPASPVVPAAASSAAAPAAHQLASVTPLRTARPPAVQFGASPTSQGNTALAGPPRSAVAPVEFGVAPRQTRVPAALDAWPALHHTPAPAIEPAQTAVEPTAQTAAESPAQAAEPTVQTAVEPPPAPPVHTAVEPPVQTAVEPPVQAAVEPPAHTAEPPAHTAEPPVQAAVEPPAHTAEPPAHTAEPPARISVEPPPAPPAVEPPAPATLARGWIMAEGGRIAVDLVERGTRELVLRCRDAVPRLGCTGMLRLDDGTQCEVEVRFAVPRLGEFGVTRRDRARFADRAV